MDPGFLRQRLLREPLLVLGAVDGGGPREAVLSVLLEGDTRPPPSLKDCQECFDFIIESAL